MSEKPHTVAIGAFVAGAVLIAVTTLLFVLGSGFGTKEKVVMVFDGSVTGLNIGAPLAIRGVKVGQVTDIELILDSDNLELIMLVEADFDPGAIRRRGAANDDLTEELLNRGLRAQLNTQSLLTGLLYIQLDFHPQSELVLRDIDSPYFQFPTVPSDLERITRKLQDIDFGALAEDVEAMVEQFYAVASSEDVQALPRQATAALQSLTSLSEELRAQLASSGPRLDSVLDETAATVSSAHDELPRLSELIESNLQTLEIATDTFRQAMGNVEDLASQDSATLYRLNNALAELARAGRSLQALARTLEEQPESLIQGRSQNKR
ncbi:MAG: paraquat-inducible protein B [Halioglobus sp.]|nr:paraquat-inducible protein B [Halioglobus sp.]